MINLILKKTNNLYTIHEEADSDNYFTPIKQTLEEKFGIKNGINYEKARRGDHIELTKMCLVILSNGIAVENEFIIRSCEKLDLDLYEIMTNFYNIAEKNKSRFPPNTIELYEQILFEKANTSSSSSSLSLSSSFNCKINISNEIYSINNDEDDDAIYSSLKLEEPTDKGSDYHENQEEIFFLEKRNLENKIHKKDTYIYELEIELEERQQKINCLIKSLDDLKRMRTRLNEEFTNDYNILVKEMEQEKHEKNMLEQKCQQMSLLLVEKNESQLMLEKMNTTLSDQVKFLTRRLEQETKQTSSENNTNTLRQSQTIETTFRTNETFFPNENLIVNLFNQYKKLDVCLTDIDEKMCTLKHEYNERIDELVNQNAMQLNLINMLEAKTESVFRKQNVCKNLIRLKKRLTDPIRRPESTFSLKSHEERHLIIHGYFEKFIGK